VEIEDGRGGGVMVVGSESEEEEREKRDCQPALCESPTIRPRTFSQTNEQFRQDRPSPDL